MITTPELRNLVRTRGYLLDAHYQPNSQVVKILSRIRNEYALKVGLNTYLSEMLAEIATAEVQTCQVVLPSGELAQIHQSDYNTQVQTYLRKYTLTELPYKVVRAKTVKYL